MGKRDWMVNILEWTTHGRFGDRGTQYVIVAIEFKLRPTILPYEETRYVFIRATRSRRVWATRKILTCLPITR